MAEPLAITNLGACHVARMSAPYYTMDAMRAFAGLLDDHEGPLVVRGYDANTFSLGGDLALLAEGRARRADVMAYCDACLAIALRMLERWEARRMTIAVVEGRAYGGGLEFATSCPVVLLTPTADLSYPETAYGLFPGMGGPGVFAGLHQIAPAEISAMVHRRVHADASQAAHWPGFVHFRGDGDEAERFAHAAIATGAAAALAPDPWRRRPPQLADMLEADVAAFERRATSGRIDTATMARGARAQRHAISGR